MAEVESKSEFLFADVDGNGASSNKAWKLKIMTSEFFLTEVLFFSQKKKKAEGSTTHRIRLSEQVSGFSSQYLVLQSSNLKQIRDWTNMK